MLENPADEAAGLTLGSGSASDAAPSPELEAPSAMTEAARSTPVVAIRLDVLIALGVAALYLLTRLLGLSQFPIYFFSDEAIQVVQAESLIKNGLRDAEGTLLPTFFWNYEKWNLSLSVYVHALSLALFGKSVFVARATGAIVGMLGLLGVAVVLKRGLGLRYWWLGPLALTATPVWFLHSRTAFEVAMAIGFYGAFLACYLLYRYGSPRWVYLALLCAGATFYSYAGGQGLILVTMGLLFLSDLRYHLRQRWQLLLAAVLLTVTLALPYLRFNHDHPNVLSAHLEKLGSYLTWDIPLGEKVQRFSQIYLSGLNPAYWFSPTYPLESARHEMKGMGQAPLLFAPFVLLGLAVCLMRWRSAAHRAVLIALLAVPVSAATTSLGITRSLAMVIPIALLAALGFEQLLRWLPARLPARHLAAGAGLAMAIFSIYMLRVALERGPTWYTDYGMYGMQYGGIQVFPAVHEELSLDPTAQVFMSPNWANDPGAVAQFFLTEEERQRFFLGHSIDGILHGSLQPAPNQIFILPAEEYDQAVASPKLVVEPPRRIIRYPDRRPGFYFVRLSYVPNIEEVLAAERAELSTPQEADLEIGGVQTHVVYSRVQEGAMENLFDQNFNSLTRGLEANPFTLDFTFAQPRALSGLTVTTGSMDFELEIVLRSAAGEELHRFHQTYLDLPDDPTVEASFGQSYEAAQVHIAILQLDPNGAANVHIRELAFKE